MTLVRVSSSVTEDHLDDSGVSIDAPMIQSGAPILDLVIRTAESGDLPYIQAIYAPYVCMSVATFEEEIPDLAMMQQRFSNITRQGFPYLVAVSGDEIIGFAYANRFRDRSAYRYTVEDSIYIHRDLHGRGIGGRLLSVLKQHCTDLGFRQMVTVIGIDTAELLNPSIQLHQRQGFKEQTRLYAVGFKLGRWTDTVMMQCSLGSGAQTSPLQE